MRRQPLLASIIGTIAFSLVACSGPPSAGPEAPNAPERPALDASVPPAARDASLVDASRDADAAPPLTASACFADLTGPVKGPDYDQFAPVVQAECAGTHHQTIAGVEKLVFVGDSVTTGTPPSLPTQIYRTLLAQSLTKKFGPLEVLDCSAWGARMDDLLAGKDQLHKCFPGAVEPKRTLVVMTMGGNDISAWAKDGLGTLAATAAADQAASDLRAGIAWVKDAKRFPKGSFFVLGNAYEYTDTSGDLMSCPAASLAGFKKGWPEGAPAVVHFQEEIMHAVVDHGADMVFLLEHFCGHGFRRDDPSLQCYRGPGAEAWFDLTCIHPNPTGHARIAQLFQKVIDG